MNPIRRTAIAAVAAFAALAAVPTAAVAASWQPTIVLKSNVSGYTNYTEARMRDSRVRISVNIQRSRLRAGVSTQMMRDVDQGIGLIRYRVAMYGKDGRITAFESNQIQNLARAIASDLTKTYGPIDSWMLL